MIITDKISFFRGSPPNRAGPRTPVSPGRSGKNGKTNPKFPISRHLYKLNHSHSLTGGHKPIPQETRPCQGVFDRPVGPSSGGNSRTGTAACRPRSPTDPPSALAQCCKKTSPILLLYFFRHSRLSPLLLRRQDTPCYCAAVFVIYRIISTICALYGTHRHRRNSLWYVCCYSNTTQGLSSYAGLTLQKAGDSVHRNFTGKEVG